MRLTTEHFLGKRLVLGLRLAQLVFDFCTKLRYTADLHKASRLGSAQGGDQGDRATLATVRVIAKRPLTAEIEMFVFQSRAGKLGVLGMLFDAWRRT